MPRKITQGTVGNTVLGRLFAVDNTLSSNDSNENLAINPPAGGDIHLVGNTQISTGNSLRLSNAADTAYVSLTAGAITSNVNFTLPINDGDDLQVLKTDGSGALEWVQVNVPLTDDNASGTAVYPVLSSSTTAFNSDQAKVGSSYLSYVPSSGTLTTRDLSCTRNATITATLQAATITETSSITLKENISPIENALDSIMQLAGVIYDRKDGSTKNEAGLIAEDVDKVLPNLVTKDKKGNPEAIHYTKLSAYLIEAVKTLKDEIDNLKGNK